MLSKVHSQRLSFQSSDIGDLVGLRCLTKRIFYVKKGRPLICIFNVGEELHNGSRCQFIEKD